MNSSSHPFTRALPLWQVLLVLVGFPALYLANSFTPWSLGLFGQADRSWYIPFWTSIVLLHWATTGITLWFVFQAGGTLSAIGLNLTPLRVVRGCIALVAVAGLLLWLRTTWPLPDEPPRDWQIIYPFTTAERVFILFGSCTAGVCEELIYRGFSIRVMQGRGVPTWLAILLAGISFSLVHGIAGVILLPIYMAFAIVFSGIFLWRGSLLTAILVHTFWDMMMVLAV
jgi:CAAX protease family protein